jgi:hypothetical protein
MGRLGRLGVIIYGLGRGGWCVDCRGVEGVC